MSPFTRLKCQDSSDLFFLLCNYSCDYKEWWECLGSVLSFRRDLWPFWVSVRSHGQLRAKYSPDVFPVSGVGQHAGIFQHLFWMVSIILRSRVVYVCRLQTFNPDRYKCTNRYRNLQFLFSKLITTKIDVVPGTRTWEGKSVSKLVDLFTNALSCNSSFLCYCGYFPNCIKTIWMTIFVKKMNYTSSILLTRSSNYSW